MNSNLKKLMEALDDKEQLENIGKQLIQSRIEKYLKRRKPGRMPTNYDVCLVFKKGDSIPVSFRGLPNMKLDKNGFLLEDWTDTWCQWNETGGEDWSDGWGECWDNSCETPLSGGLHFRQIPEKHVDEIDIAIFSDKEREILKKIGLDTLEK